MFFVGSLVSKSFFSGNKLMGSFFAPNPFDTFSPVVDGVAESGNESPNTNSGLSYTLLSPTSTP